MNYLSYRNDGTPAFNGDPGAGIGRGRLNLNNAYQRNLHWDYWEVARRLRMKDTFDGLKQKLKDLQDQFN